jgi:hypothetical protein
MDRVKTVLRIAGIVVAASGVMCFPIGYGVSPKRDLSLFDNLADLGAFVRMGSVLTVLGLLVLGLSFIVPGEMED